MSALPGGFWRCTPEQFCLTEDGKHLQRSSLGLFSNLWRGLQILGSGASGFHAVASEWCGMDVAVYLSTAAGVLLKI